MVRKTTEGAGFLRDLLSVDVPVGGRVLLHVPTGTYLALDASASLVVDLLAASPSAADASALLAERVGISESRARADVRLVLDAVERLRRGGGRTARKPSVQGVVHELASWWRLPGERRLAVLKVVAALTAVEIGLRTLDVARLSRVFRTPLSPSEQAPAPPTAGASAISPSEVRLLWAIDWVGRRWLFPVTCLRSALLIGVVLRRRHPVLRLGIMPDGVTAHAWVEAEGVSYGAGEVSGVFQRVL